MHRCKNSWLFVAETTEEDQRYALLWSPDFGPIVANVTTVARNQGNQSLDTDDWTWIDVPNEGETISAPLLTDGHENIPRSTATLLRLFELGNRWMQG